MRTTSGDGIRVWLNEESIIDDRTWHAPTQNNHEFELQQPTELDIRVERFELDGYALLIVDLELIGE